LFLYYQEKRKEETSKKTIGTHIKLSFLGHLSLKKDILVFDLALPDQILGS
jgi:hypothetical protein